MGSPADFRASILRTGYWLGWLSIVAVLLALALGIHAHDRAAVIGLVSAAAVSNAAVSLVPWRQWLEEPRGRHLLDLWTLGLIVFVSMLVLLAGGRSNFDLLLFLIGPFIAVAHEGRRRAAWLAAMFAAFIVVMVVAPVSLSLPEAVARGLLLSGTVALAYTLAAIVRQQAAARAKESARAELEIALLAETHHRIKNSLQTVSDLLFLGKPEHGAGRRAFERTAARIRTIAAIHELLADRGGRAVDARDLLAALASACERGTDAEIRVQGDPVQLDPAKAQQLAVIANELITNAVEHGTPPVVVRLSGGTEATLTVCDEGSLGYAPAGLGLRLVEQIARSGLRGEFRLQRRPSGGTEATLRFQSSSDANPSG